MQVLARLSQADRLIVAFLASGFFRALPVALGAPCQPMQRKEDGELCCGETEVDAFNTAYHIERKKNKKNCQQISEICLLLERWKKRAKLLWQEHAADALVQWMPSTRPKEKP
jgi:hypothetical protein